MRVTKFVHSCLLVEHDDAAVLIDPGDYSWTSIDLDALPRLDAVLITHRHHDHYNAEAVKQLAARFPEASFITNREVAAILKVEGIASARTLPDWLTTDTAKHPTPPWQDRGCINTVFHLFDRLTHPGDSHTFKETREILALPITAPWGSMMDGLNWAVKLKPKVVLPIHDWHWHEAARQDGYNKAQRVLAEHNIRFVPLETGVSVEIDT